MEKQAVVGLVGPTASGKTALSMLLSQYTPIEIICMDSMQVYQGMDIGTAKPDKEERARIPHHMLDVVSPNEPYDVAQYRTGALEAIEGIIKRNHLPVLVGGTGLYLRALSQGLSLGHTPRVDCLREKYETILNEIGNAALHQHLQEVDPVSADRLHQNDTRRVIRALEVYEATGKPFSAQELPPPSGAPYRFVLYAVDYPRQELYERIERRVDGMLAAGLPCEVERLLAQGVAEDSQSMQGLGYKELLPYLKDEADLAQCTDLIKKRTRNYAKRQLTWFRPDERIRWLQPEGLANNFISHLGEDLEIS